MLTPDQKGAIAETAIAHEAVKLGYDVYRPINEGTRSDLIFGFDGRLTRVQCKWASLRGDVIGIPCYSTRRSAGGFLKRPYTPAEIDAYAAYCPELNRCYFIPIEGFTGQVTIRLRLHPARNNQRRGIHWARDFELAARLGRPGAVAQLGERRAGSAKVRGSSPLGSIDSVA